MTNDQLRNIIEELEQKNASLGAANDALRERESMLEASLRQLQAEEEKNHALIANSLVAIFLTLPDGTILETNHAARELFGYTEEEFKQLGRRGFVDHSDGGLEQQLVKREREGSIQGELTGIRKTGERFTCEYTSVAFTNSRGEKRVGTMLLDISLRKQQEKKNIELLAEANEMRALLKNVLDSVSDGYVALDKDWNFTYLNEKGAALLNGYTPAQLLGKNIWEIFPAGTNAPFYDLYHKVMKERVPVAMPEYYAPWNMYFENRVYPSADGGITVFFTDVTEQRTAEAKVKKTQNEMQLILDNTDEWFLVIDRDLRIITQNKAARQRMAHLSGREPGREESLSEFLDAKQVEDIRELYSQVLTGKKIQHTYHSSEPDGIQRIFNTNYTPIFNAQHEVDQFMVTSREITVEESIRQALLESEEKYRTLFYSNPLPLWIYDIETKQFLEVNDAAIRHYGYSREEFLSMKVTQIRPPEDVAAFEELVRAVKEGDRVHHGEWRHLKKGNELINVEITSYRINFAGRTAALVLSNDITERKRHEEAVRNSEMRFRSLIEKGSEIIALHDSKGMIIYMSPSMQTTLGYNPEERIGKPVFDAIHEEDQPALKQKLALLLANPGSSANAQWRHRHADGSWHWMDGVATNLLNDPAVNAVVHNFRDITRQKAAEKRIILEKELSEMIINSLPGIFYLYDEQG
ncbi:MAG: hypothetical protein JWQ78_763, partial [Sediminibacterium sp.]|nr:hypothetical protein [Sediminibacterium sp.]